MAAFSEIRVDVFDSVRRGGDLLAINVRIEPSNEPTASAVGLLGDTRSAVTATGTLLVWTIALLSRLAWGLNYVNVGFSTYILSVEILNSCNDPKLKSSCEKGLSVFAVDVRVPAMK